jgi:sulfate permease, SulP family
VRFRPSSRVDLTPLKEDGVCSNWAARSRSRPTWLSPRVFRVEALPGLVVALALIPEAVSFSIIAGGRSRIGLFASFPMAVTIAFTGGRPAMISAATGAIALVVAPLVRDHGAEYLHAD